MRLSTRLLRTYAAVDRDAAAVSDGDDEDEAAAQGASVEHEVAMLTPVVLDVLAGFGEGAHGGGGGGGGGAAGLTFREHVGWLYPLLCELVCCRSKPVRVAVSELLQKQVAPLVSGLPQRG